MSIKWRCTLCGQCCKYYVPLVTPHDIHRLQEALRLPLADFVAFYALDGFQEPVEDSDARFFQTKYGKIAMGFSQKELPGGGAGCVFLKDNLCSVYAVRPLICRQYPFQPQDYDNPHGPYQLKPDPCFGNHATDQTVEEQPVRRNYLTYQEEYTEYVEKVRVWNADPGSSGKEIDDFLQFLGLQWSQEFFRKEVAGMAKPGAPKPGAPKPGAPKR